MENRNVESAIVVRLNRHRDLSNHDNVAIIVSEMIVVLIGRANLIYLKRQYATCFVLVAERVSLSNSALLDNANLGF